jgi:DNA mismatch repair ATPase MutS
VCATRLRLSRVALGTAMRIDDSLQDGKSLFYSVLERLKSIVELAGREVPLLFLLDEILQGTNSHDRRLGAEGVIRSLVERGAIGLVTTHDLALTEIVDSLDGRAANVHFEDRIVDGRMTFDYQLRDGVVQRSNALELMRLMGLDVPDREDAVR